MQSLKISSSLELNEYNNVLHASIENSSLKNVSNQASSWQGKTYQRSEMTWIIAIMYKK